MMKFGEYLPESALKAVSQAKNIIMNISEIESKVREATSNDAWGASGTLMQEISHATYNYEQFNEVMSTIYKRFAETGKNWRHVYKALILLEYLIKNGSERVVSSARDHVYEIRGLSHFDYIDEKGKDQGINVRNRSKEIVALLNDSERIREERAKAKANRDKYIGVSAEETRYGGFGSNDVDRKDNYSSYDSHRDHYSNRDSERDHYRERDNYSSSKNYSNSNNYSSSRGDYDTYDNDHYEKEDNLKSTSRPVRVEYQESTVSTTSNQPIPKLSMNTTTTTATTTAAATGGFTDDFGDFAASTTTTTTRTTSTTTNNNHNALPVDFGSTATFSSVPTAFSQDPFGDFASAPSTSSTTTTTTSTTRTNAASLLDDNLFGSVAFSGSSTSTYSATTSTSAPIPAAALMMQGDLLMASSNSYGSTTNPDTSAGAKSGISVSSKKSDWAPNDLVDLSNLKKYDSAKHKETTTSKPMGAATGPSMSSNTTTSAFGGMSGAFPQQPGTGANYMVSGFNSAPPMGGFGAMPGAAGAAPAGFGGMPPSGGYGQGMYGGYGGMPPAGGFSPGMYGGGNAYGRPPAQQNQSPFF